MQNILEEQLEGLSAELPVKKSLISDQQLLYEKVTNLKLENVSVIMHLYFLVASHQLSSYIVSSYVAMYTIHILHS